MPDDVFAAAVQRIANHCRRSGQRAVSIIFHGGEPTLVGVHRFAAYCQWIREALRGVAHPNLTLQTNGVLLDDRWGAVIKHFCVDVGVSLDGPRDVHDRVRVTHSGGGSHDDVVRSIRLLRKARIPVRILCVIPFGVEPLRVHRYLLDLGPEGIQYLFPDYTHDTIAEVHAQYGPTPSLDFLGPVLDEWWSLGVMSVTVEPFREMTRLVLGGESRVDYFGNPPLRFLFVETDGAIEGLDVLRVCGEGMAGTGLNVDRDEFMDIGEASPLHRCVIFDGVARPEACRGCPEEATCTGGYLPHRHSRTHGFDGRSVWCRDILGLFAHLRTKLGVGADETARRQSRLRILSQAGRDGVQP